MKGRTRLFKRHKDFNWEHNGLNQTWKGKNVYLYPPRDLALKNEQPKSTKLFEKTNYFKKSNQRVWLEQAHKKWLKREFDEGIVFITSTEVALTFYSKIWNRFTNLYSQRTPSTYKR